MPLRWTAPPAAAHLRVVPRPRLAEAAASTLPAVVSFPTVLEKVTLTAPPMTLR